MNREDIIRMAREADLGFLLNENWLMHEEIERFAALVASHALVEPCCGNYDQCQKVCMPRAASAEREACAKECDACICTAQASEAIRARGEASIRGQA